MGPVTDYIADCGANDCSHASAGALGWSKLATYVFLSAFLFFHTP
jgi:hypothetical protein